MIGIDVVDIERMRAVLGRSPQLARRLFTDAERAYCEVRPDPASSFAGTLAAKEAVVKALRLSSLTGWAARIEIERGPAGAPSARVEGGQEVGVSISHDGPVAVAVALARGPW